MRDEFVLEILTSTDANEILRSSSIQSLWSGYGEIAKHDLEGGKITSVITKHILFPNASNHPRGWDTNHSHERKVKSYQVEMAWYQQWSQQCGKACRVADFYGSKSINAEHLLILEDLDDTGFSSRKTSVGKAEAIVCLNWLASFHATFFDANPTDLWETGTYWHLSTRPDELEAMSDGSLKSNATKLDAILTNCEFQTLVHGDAKVANFCFTEHGTRVAAVDFQYVGKGCGMKDVAYFLGSCLTSNECLAWEEELLNAYFSRLKDELKEKHPSVYFNQLENEWRRMYSIAWADFARFLMGWMPTHQKLNAYMNIQVEKALSTI